MSVDYVFSLSRVQKAYGRKVVLDNISLSFIRGARIGVIGANGSGKTTLLRVLAGVETEFEGERIADPKASIGYLPQEPHLTPGTVKDNIEEGVAHVRALLDEQEELGAKFGEVEGEEMEKLSARFDQVQALIEITNAYEIDHVIEQASHALGCPPMDKDVGPLSGGERRRVALCKLLLQHPDVLLLDEPTNHLDADAVQWLETHLDQYAGTVISITHDRYFLDNVAQWMLEMDEGRAHPYHGNYSAYLEQKEKRMLAADRKQKARKRILKTELEWIQRNPKGRMAKNKARIKEYERLYEEDQAESKQDDQVTLHIPITRKLGEKVLRVKGITKRFGDRTVIDDLSFEVPAGAIVGVIGPNGTGKTTLLKIIAGRLEADAGEVDIGPSVDLCFVDQDRAELDPNRTVFQEITDDADMLTLGKMEVNARAYVSKFNFRKSDQQQLVGTLSGGQRNRVQLAKMLRQGGNVLLVDEPTNDLDVSTIRVLEEALEGFAGSAVVVSHDRFFLDRVATHILAFSEDATARFFEGNYDAYRQRIAEEGGDLEGPGKHRRLT